MAENRGWILNSYPTGMPVKDNWTFETLEMPKPGPGEVLIKTIYLSVDPYMRGRISAAANYAAGVQIGEVMHGGGVGIVVESNDASLKVGDVVESFHFGWQEYNVQAADALNRVDPSLGPIHSALSYLGMPGLTAYFALLHNGGLKEGDDVIISAASGAVGQIAGQIATIKGARPVAIASSDEKLAWCRELGYADTINYRTVDDLEAAIKKACPDGVDVFFDNTAGPIHDAVMKNLALYARIIICGTVALAAKFDEKDIGERFLRAILVSRAKMQGFLLWDYTDHFETAKNELSGWVKEGKLRHREDWMEGIDSMPDAFLRLLRSENFGKQLIKIADDPFEK